MPDKNETQAAEKAWMYPQRDVNYVTVSPNLPDACAGCRWFNSYGSYYDGGQHPDCRIVDSYPNPIEATGWCDKFDAMPVEPLAQTPMPVVIVDADVTAVVVEGKAADEAPADPEAEAEEDAPESDATEAVLDVPSGIRKLTLNIQAAASEMVAKALGRKDAELSGFKVFQQSDGRYRWTAWYSNNFEDRDNEFFREKGFDRYVKRLDMGLVDMPELWAWHTKGTRSGVADWVDRIGHFHVATGLYDDTPEGAAAAKYDQKHYKDYGVSHGFVFRERDVEVVDGKKVYNDWNTFEISPLPLHRAANELTAFAVEVNDGVKETVMDAEKRKHLAEKFAALGGEEYVAKLEAETEKRGKEIEELRGFKDFVHPDGDSTAKANKEAVEAAGKAFDELMPQLIEDAGTAVTASLAAVKATTNLKADNAALREEVASLKALLEQRPRASQSDSTLLDTKDGKGKELLEEVHKQMVERDNFWGTDVVKAP